VQAWIVDTFADDQYAGNPAGVVLREKKFPPLREMQAMASVLGLPTIAFVAPEGVNRYRIRWFTPKKELSICGHATLASAACLFASDRTGQMSELCFHTRSGPLYARRSNRYISLDLPRMEVDACEVPDGLQEALGTDVVHCARSIDDLLIEVESEEIVAALQPDFEMLKKLPGRGQVVTARCTKREADFVSRSFFPVLGVNEDQVCVSAHCKLAPYWGARLNKQKLVALQLSVRGGRLLLELVDERVRVAGTAIVRERTTLKRMDFGRPTAPRFEHA
jgi:PhzF family phenazine biosynthesis protein